MKTDPILGPMLDRREFTLAAILAMLSGVTITISACGRLPATVPAGVDSREA